MLWLSPSAVLAFGVVFGCNTLLLNFTMFLGTYDGHGGACWCLDPKWDNTHLITGAADNSIRLGSQIWIKTGVLQQKKNLYFFREKLISGVYILHGIPCSRGGGGGKKKKKGGGGKKKK